MWWLQRLKLFRGKDHFSFSLRSKRFRGVGSRPNFARAKHRSGSVPWSFFAPQSHENACYAGYFSFRAERHLVNNHQLVMLSVLFLSRSLF